MTLNFDVAKRQTLGSFFEPSHVEELLSGRLTIPPHPGWSLPAQIDWRADPFKDKNWKSQYHMLRWLEPLRRAAARGDDAAFDMWLRYVRDWVEQNPRNRPAHPWVWSDMVDGIRAIQLCIGAPLVRDRSPEDLGWLEASIREHAAFLSDEKNIGIANHAMHQHEALFVCGRVLGDPAMTALALDRLDQLLREQYDEQGVNGEGSITYHYNNFLWWERALRRLDVEGVARPAAAARHALAPEEIAHATRPDGTLVTIGDTDPLSPRKMKTAFTDYVSSRGSEGEPPSEVIKIYDAGYVFGRSGWGETEKNYDEETYFSVSFGRSDRVHGHPDGGSLTYSASGVNWVVDPGKYQYGDSTPRRHFLSRRAHSLVTVEGRPVQEGATVDLLHSRLDERGYDLLFEDSSFVGVSLTRRVVYSVSGEYMVVVDQVRSRDQITATQRWQLGPGVAATSDRNRVLMASGPHKAALRFVGNAPQVELVTGQDKPFDGWVATGWKKKAAATAVLAKKSGTNFRFVTVIATGKADHPTVETLPTAPATLLLKVDSGKVSEYVRIDRETVSFPTDPSSELNPAAKQAHAVRATKTGRPHELDTQSRSEVFGLLESSRRAGWNSSAADRRSSATQLQTEMAERNLGGNVDLGLVAGVTDLLQTERGRANPSLVEPHRTALVNWSDDRTWRPTFYAFPIQSHRDEYSVEKRPTAPAIHTVAAGPLLVPFALDPAQGDTLTVLFQGAVDRAKTRVPIFTRLRYQTELGAGPTASFADPTLDLSSSMRLGWYLGTEKTDLAAAIAATIERVARSLGVSNVVLAGSSGGGFAALQVGANLAGAVVVAMSPQTDLRRYSPRLVTAATAPAFGLNAAPTTGHLLKRVSVVDRMRSTGLYPRTVIVSNPGDVPHVKHHEGPLVEACQAAGHGDQIEVVSLDLGPGHRSVGNEDYGRIMKDIYSSL